ncbi:DNA binding, partial [Halocaridina rubra]
MESGDIPQEVIELIQSGIDEVLEEKAERTHLTAVHVKNIIKNVMTDGNVLAMRSLSVSQASSPFYLQDNEEYSFLKNRTAQRMLKFEEETTKEELVSQRTRSKLPLTETPLECLEMAFKPPDVTNDMYEMEMDDEDWKSFLIDFIHPLESTDVAEDEEADPEYNILEDKEDASDLKEDMRRDRAVQISKKEINELLTELLGTLNGDEETVEPFRKHLSQHFNIQKKKTTPVKICKPPKEKTSGPPPKTIWVEVLTAKFTAYQLEVLRMQMAQHVQLLAGTIFMCCGEDLSPVNDGAKEML